MSSVTDTIVAPATAPGVGAIAVIRLSGKEAISLCDSVFNGKNLNEQKSHTIHFGHIMNGDKVVDEVLVSVFKGPNSFTKEDVIEISTHGSDYIVQEIIRLLIQRGARSAMPGEFTKRAFMNGRFDLAQAEAVADLIASDSAASHKAAIDQLKGGFSSELKELREQLIHFASMVELELDFGEEDVEFADLEQLKRLVNETLVVINRLVDSFTYGNAIKEGIPVAIVGKPNAGKSTLLNALLNEEKAIVTDIPGTTRDYIEDQFILEGIKFRFIDTAGLRETEDVVEAAGVERSMQQLKKASIGLYLFDAKSTGRSELEAELEKLQESHANVYAIGNKIDIGVHDSWKDHSDGIVWISASQKTNLKELTDMLVSNTKVGKVSGDQTVVTNSRHYANLFRTKESLEKVLEGIDLQVTQDFLAMDIRQALHYLGEITGEITTDDLLANIFSKFCIGK